MENTEILKQNDNIGFKIIDSITEAISGGANTSGTSGDFKIIGIDFTGLDILIIVLIIIAIVIFGGYQYLVFQKDEKIKERKGTLFQIKPGIEVVYKKQEKKFRMSRLLETFYSSAGSFFDTLRTVEPTYSLEIHANGIGGYGTYIWVPEDEVQHLPAKMRSLYEQPEVVLDEDEPMAVLQEKIADEKGFSKVEEFLTAEYQMSGAAYLPIREWVPGNDPDDPMEQVYGIFDGLRGNHIAGLIVTLKPTNSKWKEEGMKVIQEMEYDMPQKKGAFDFISGSGEEQQAPIKKKRLDAFQKAQFAAMVEKVKQDGFQVVIRVYSSDESIFQLLCNALEKRYKSDYNQLVKTNSNVSIEEMKLRWFDKSNMVLNIDEIATVFHFADSETKAERLQRGGSSTAAPDENLRVIGEEDYDIFEVVSGVSKS